MAAKPKWELAWSAEQRRWYYSDRYSGKSQWHRPKDCPLDASTKPAPTQQEDTSKKGRDNQEDKNAKPTGLPKGWEAHLDSESKKWFYYHKATKRRTWYKPLPDPDGKGGDGGDVLGQKSSTLMTKKASTTPKNKNEQQSAEFSHWWDQDQFATRLELARKSPQFLKQVLQDVWKDNEEFTLIMKMRVPTTLPVTYQECTQAIHEKAVQGYKSNSARITMSPRTVADAICYYASDPNRVVCGLNPACGKAEGIGGGYETGELTVEADLCRRIPVLYPSLKKAKDAGAYPFGPSTCTSPQRQEKYSDVLFTPYLEHDTRKQTDHECCAVLRGPGDSGFYVCTHEQRRRCCIVHASPPDIGFRARHKVVSNLSGGDGEILDSRFLFHTLTSVLVAPVLKEPRCTTLVCGAFGCEERYSLDPAQVATIFAQVLQSKQLDGGLPLARLYHEIHFAIPKESAEDSTYFKFQEVFKQCGLLAADQT